MSVGPTSSFTVHSPCPVLSLLNNYTEKNSRERFCQISHARLPQLYATSPQKAYAKCDIHKGPSRCSGYQDAGCVNDESHDPRGLMVAVRVTPVEKTNVLCKLPSGPLEQASSRHLAMSTPEK